MALISYFTYSGLDNYADAERVNFDLFTYNLWLISGIALCFPRKHTRENDDEYEISSRDMAKLNQPAKKLQPGTLVD